MSKLRTEKEFSDWREGFRSGASLANDFANDLMWNFHQNPHNKTWLITDEAYQHCVDKLKVGLDKEMRVGQRAGLDYYFAATQVKD